MKTNIQSVLDRLALEPKKLLLIDAMGALMTAFLTGVVLVRYEHMIGMPIPVLYYLAIMACALFVFSFSCALFVKSKWTRYLKIIIAANLTYCFLTLGLLVMFYENITPLGMVYFLIEAIIVGALARGEFLVYLQLDKKG